MFSKLWNIIVYESLERRWQYKEVPTDNYEMPYDSNRQTEINVDAVMLREEPRYPKEIWKTVTAFILLFMNIVLCMVSLSLLHERMPDRTIYTPLPDVVLDNVPRQANGVYYSEILVMIQTYTFFAVIIFHKHRFILLRRVFLMLAILYFLRSITIYVTVIPLSSVTRPCSPKADVMSVSVVAKRVLHLLSGFGLTMSGRHIYCGDYIFSGHTVMLVLGYLMIAEYSPRRWFFLHWISWLIAMVGAPLLLIGHGHYTIDVLVAYYITTRLFWTYHTLANNQYLLRQPGTNNYIGREWWLPLFRHFERNVRGVIPNQYEWPLPPWPRTFYSKFPNES